MSDDTSLGVEPQPDIQEAEESSRPRRKRGRPPGSVSRPKLRTDSARGARDGRKGASKAQPLVRSDSEILADLDGFGQPFNVKLVPGWKPFWVSRKDMARHSHRAWQQLTWDDERVLEYRHLLKGKDNEPIEYRGLFLHAMPEAISAKYTALDPARRQHQRAMAYMHADSQQMPGVPMSDPITTKVTRTTMTVDI